MKMTFDIKNLMQQTKLGTVEQISLLDSNIEILKQSIVLCEAQIAELPSVIKGIDKIVSQLRLINDLQRKYDSPAEGKAVSEHALKVSVGLEQDMMKDLLKYRGDLISAENSLNLIKKTVVLLEEKKAQIQEETKKESN